MPRYAVISPEIAEIVPIPGLSDGPIEYFHEYIEVEADTAKQAKVLAVREWRKKGRLRYCYDNENPYKGLKVEDTSKWEDDYETLP